MGIEIKIDIISIIVSILALIIAYFSFKESRITHIENGRASFTVELMKINSSIYVDLHNIGKNHAYNFNFTINDPFPNSFVNIHTIKANSHYRYELINTKEISQYPAEVLINISYNDIYSQIEQRNYSFELSLLDCSKYNVYYNKELDCYDINKF